MAIDTNDKKLSLMEWDIVWEPGLVMDEAAGFDQGDRQQLLWGYSGVLWEVAVIAVGLVTAAFTAKAPDIGYVAKQPAMAFAAKKPNIDFEG